MQYQTFSRGGDHFFVPSDLVVEEWGNMSFVVLHAKRGDCFSGDGFLSYAQLDATFYGSVYMV